MPSASSAMGLKPGDRVALIAETGAEFAACFFGAVYAGLWPVPLPLPTSFGGREAYVEQLRVMLNSSDPTLFLCPPELLSYAEAAGAERGVPARDWDSLGSMEVGAAELPAPDTDEVAYLQYSSGSTRFPHGVAVTHRQLLSNLRAHGIGLQVRGNRPLHFVAALVSRHGASRLHAVADVASNLGRLSENRGFRAPASRLARHDYPQSGHLLQLFADLRL